MDQTSTPSYEFEGFRLDTVLQVLSSPHGEPIPLPSRAFDTLRYLVERAGELVDKATLMKAVWPQTLVEENNLNQCIFTLRKVFGEAAGERRFILTVPGRGFKFVAPVTVIANASLGVARSSSPSDEAGLRLQVSARHRLWMGVAILCAMAAVVAGARMVFIAKSLPVTVPAEYQALTDASDSATAPALSSDGHLLAYIKGGDAFLSPGQIWVKSLPNGEAIQLTHDAGLIFAPTFTPDGAHIAFSTVNKDLGGTWDTELVPITGGKLSKLLPNASGLSFIGPHTLMYSEFKSGMHLGIVTSGEDRSDRHEIYLPDHERGMAHFSFASPDRKSVLVVEMNRSGEFGRCRLVPFDGSSPGSAIGPEGACLSAAWSPNGEWMYLSVVVAGHGHLWRQRYPNGQPQQITFGPTDEEMVVCALDGRSLLTSLGRQESTIWLHDASGERALTTEGYSYSPWLAPRGNRVYFLVASNSEPPELWSVETDSGNRRRILTGFNIDSYDISPDEREIVFTSKGKTTAEIWVAPLDRQTPPRLLLSGGDEASFAGAGDIFFRSLGGQVNFLHRMKSDGTQNSRVFEKPITEFHGVSPDGKWASVGISIEEGISGTFLAPIGGGNAPLLLRKGWWPSQWSRDGKVLYLEAGATEDSQRHGRTAALPLGLDGLPTESVTSPSQAVIPHEVLSLSISSADLYALVKSETHRNIYRIPLHD